MHFGTFVPFHRSQTIVYARQPTIHRSVSIHTIDWVRSVCARMLIFSVWLKCSRRILVTIGSFQFTMIRWDSKWSIASARLYTRSIEKCVMLMMLKIVCEFFSDSFVWLNKCSICDRSRWQRQVVSHLYRDSRDAMERKKTKRQQLVLLFNDLRSVQMRSRSHF